MSSNDFTFLNSLDILMLTCEDKNDLKSKEITVFGNILPGSVNINAI